MSKQIIKDEHGNVLEIDYVNGTLTQLHGENVNYGRRSEGGKLQTGGGTGGPHAETHHKDGSDPLTPEAIGAVPYDDTPGLFADTPGAVGDIKLLGNTLYVRGLQGWQQVGITKGGLSESPASQFPGAVAWYSTRFRNGAHTGLAVRVRRHSDDLHRNVEFNGRGVLAADSFISNEGDSSTATTLGEFVNEETTKNLTGFGVSGGTLSDEPGGSWILKKSSANTFAYKDYVFKPGDEQNQLSVTVNVMLPSSNTLTSGVQIFSGTSPRYRFNQQISARDEFVSVTFNLAAGDVQVAGNYRRRIYIAPIDGGNNQSYAAAEDSIEIKDVVVTNVTHTATILAWYGQILNGHNLVNSTTTKQPLIARDGQVLEAVTFDGSDDYLLGPTNSFPSAPANQVLDIWVYMIAKFSRGTTTRAGVYGHRNSGNHPPYNNAYQFGSSTGELIIKTRDANANVVAVNAPHPNNNTFGLFTAHYRIGGGKVSLETFFNGARLGGEEKTTANETYNSSVGSILGARSAADNFSKIEAREIICYADTNLVHDRGAIEAFLASEHGITLTA